MLLQPLIQGKACPRRDGHRHRHPRGALPERAERRRARAAPQRHLNGAYIQELDGVEDRNISRNDTRFGQGRLTQRLTEHYNDIALMMPVFERARQMMGLLYSVMKLREGGYQPHPDVQAAYSGTLRKFEKMPPQSRNRLIMKSPPFRVDFV